MNANLATYTSGYVAPRTPVANAQETVSQATRTVATSSPVSVPETPKNDMEDMPDFTSGKGVDDDLPPDDTTVSTDDDDWINSVLNS